MYRSVPHIPDALISKITSRGPGVGSGNSLSSSLRSPRNTTPFMASSWYDVPQRYGMSIQLMSQIGYFRPTLVRLTYRPASASPRSGHPTPAHVYEYLDKCDWPPGHREFTKGG